MQWSFGGGEREEKNEERVRIVGVGEDGSWEMT